MPSVVTPSIERLLDILTLRRGHGSVGERKLVEQVLRPYDLTTLTDTKGTPMAYTKVIGDNPTVLYTCHIDTVHPVDMDAKQVVLYGNDDESY
jgi:acetylornithine deacetylase/succinyl-diaminopimelate desuccinylase-like protein